MILLTTSLSVWVAATTTAPSSTPPPPAVAAPAALLLVDADADVPGRAGLEERIHAALGARVLGLDATKKIKADLQGLGLACARLDERCAAGHGQFVGVGEVVVVAFERIGTSWLVRAERVNSADARVLDGAVGQLATRPDDGGVGAEVVAANLFASSRTPVLVPLRVTSLPRAAQLRVDGAVVPVDGDVVWLRPGAHALVIDGAPASAARAVALDDRAAGAVIALDVAAMPPSSSSSTSTPAATTLTTTVAGPAPVSLIVVTAGAVAAVVGGGFALYVNEELAPHNDPVLSDDEREAAEHRGQLSTAIAAVGVVGVVVGIALWGSTP